MFDLQPTKLELEAIWKSTLAFVPHLIIAAALMTICYVVYRSLSKWSGFFWRSQVTNPLLADMMSRIGASPILVLGIYLSLQVLNLTGLAMTLLGGTGVIGIIAGIALKNILENYFSGVMLGVRRPFANGDFIEVAGEKGVVQSLNSRGTTLIGADGTHVFIPNSTVITSIIKNHTSGPKHWKGDRPPPEASLT